MFDQAYIKHVVDSVHMTPLAGVFYQNFIGSCVISLWVLFTFITNINITDTERIVAHAMQNFPQNRDQVILLLLSSFLGFMISVSAYSLRVLTSSTMFAVIGNMCKVATVVLNWIVWDKHCSHIGVLFLLSCLWCSFLYEQAPQRVSDEKDLEYVKALNVTENDDAV